MEKVLFGSDKKAYTRLLGMVDQDNIMHFKHGSSWSASTIKCDETRESSTSNFRLQSTEVSISHDEIKALDLSTIGRIEQEFEEGFSANMQQTLINTMVDATADQPAYELDVNGDIREAIKAIHESISIGLNDDLTPSKPSLMLNQATFDKIIPKLQEISENDPNFEKELDEIRRKKWIEALIKHFENLTKFELNENERNLINDWLQQLREAQSSIMLREGCPND